MTRLLAGALCSFAAVFASAQESRTDADSAPASNAVKTALKEAAEIISSQTSTAEAELRECLKNIRDKASADAAAAKVRDLMIALTPKRSALALAIADRPLSSEMLEVQKCWQAIAETYDWFNSVALENAYREAIFYFSAQNLSEARKYFPVSAKLFKADFSDLPPFTGKDDAAAWQAMKPVLEHARKFRDFWFSIRDKQSADAAAERIGDLYREMAEFAEKHQQAIPSLTRMDISEALQKYIVSVRQTLEREALLRQAVVTRFDCEKYFGSGALIEAAEKAISDAQEYRRQALIRRFKRKQQP